MKFVEFSGGDADDDEDAGLRLPDPNADKANQQPARSLESLLMAKNKRILEELTRFRVLHGELESSLQAVTEQLAHDQKELGQQKALNERLENDLLQVNRHIPKTNGDGASGYSTPSGQNQPQDGLAGLNLGQKDTSRKPGAIPFTSSADTSILPIVTSQRDRFRQRNAELEEELRKQFEIMSDLRSEIKTLQVDNLKLYEKVRYMQSYRNETASGPSSSAPVNAPPTSFTRHDEMGKYRSMYEERMNPFEAFRGRVSSTRRYRSSPRLVYGSFTQLRSSACLPFVRKPLVLCRTSTPSRKGCSSLLVRFLLIGGPGRFLSFTPFLCISSSCSHRTNVPLIAGASFNSRHQVSPEQFHYHHCPLPHNIIIIAPVFCVCDTSEEPVQPTPIMEQTRTRPPFRLFPLLSRLARAPSPFLAFCPNSLPFSRLWPSFGPGSRWSAIEFRPKDTSRTRIDVKIRWRPSGTLTFVGISTRECRAALACCPNEPRRLPTFC